MDKKATNAFSLCSRSDTAVRKPKEQQHVFGSNAQRLTPEEIARVANHDKPIQLQQRLVTSRPTIEDAAADQSSSRQLYTISPNSKDTRIASDSPINKAPMRPKCSATTQRFRVNKVQRMNHLIPRDHPTSTENQQKDATREQSQTTQSNSVGLPTIQPIIKETNTVIKSNEDRIPDHQAEDFSMEVTAPRGLKHPHTVGFGNRRVRIPTKIAAYDVHLNESIANIELPAKQDPDQRDFTYHVMSTFHKNTFIYAVPKHCMDPNEPFNPYNIVAIAHDALFQPVNNNNRIQSHESNSLEQKFEVQSPSSTNVASAIPIGGQEVKPRWNYYTISPAGFTYYTFDTVNSKDDQVLPGNTINSTNATTTIANEPEFVSTLKWETHKMQFEALIEKKTFHKFRCYKTFMAWKQQIRATKMEYVRKFLLLHLHFSFPIFWNALQRIQALLRQLESSCVFVLDFQARSYNVQEFERAQSLHLAQQRKKLVETTKEIQEELIKVCQQRLQEEVEIPLVGASPDEQSTLPSKSSSDANIFKTHLPQEQADTVDTSEVFGVDINMSASAFARSYRQQKRMSARAKGRILSHKSLLKSHQKEDTRWTQAAVQRRKCQQLAKFIHLVEFIQRDFFFQVMSKSLRFLVSTLSMGANAAQMCSLMVRTDYLSAYRKALDQSGTSGHGETGTLIRRNSPTTITSTKLFGAGGGSMSPSSPQRGTIRGGIHCLTSGGNRMLSKQQTRRLLHYAIEGKFTSSSNTKESGIWIEGKLEDFFVRSLEQQNKNQKDYFSLEEILYVAEIGLAQAFQLPEFDATRCCIFEEQSTSRRSSSIGNIGRPTRVNSVVISTKETIDLSKIPALAPIPLFQFDLILKTTKTSNGNNLAQVIFEPSMETIQTTIREVIQSFALVFEDLDDLSSHEDIQAVLTFAENIRTSKIKSKILGNAIHLQNFQEEKEKKEGIVTKEKEDKSTNSSNCSSLPSLHERLIEIAAADEEFCEMRNEIEQLLLQAFEGATNFTKCFEEMLQWYKQNEITDFELFRILFYEKKYTLQQMEHQVTMFRHQIQQIEQLCKTKNIFFLEFHTKCFKNAFFPSPKRCLNRLQSLLPTLLHGKCLQFLYYIRNASNQIQRPLTIDMDDFTNYLKHLNEIHDQIQEKEFELTFIHDFYLLLDKKLQFQVPPDTTESFELCDPEFNALKSQVNDAMVKREVDIQEYVPMVVQAISMLEAQVDVLQNETSEENAKNFLHTLSAQQAKEMIGQFEQKAKTFEIQAHRLLMIQQVLGQNTSSSSSSFNLSKNSPQKDFQQLYTLSHEIQVKNQLWHAICQAEEYLATKSEECIKDIDLQQLNQVVDDVEKVIAHVLQQQEQEKFTIGTTIPTSTEFTALQRLEESKRVLEKLALIIHDVRNEHFHERHWLKLESKLECSFTLEEEEKDQQIATSTRTKRKYLMLPVRDLLNVGAIIHASEIHEISEEAKAEAAILKSYQDVASMWETKEIETLFKRDREGREIAVLSSENTTEIASLLEESEVLLRVIESSSYGGHSRIGSGSGSGSGTTIEQQQSLRLLSDIQLTKETLELLVMTQQQWENMQKMFSSSDFMRFFQEQSKILLAQENIWKHQIMDQLVKTPNVLTFCTNPTHRLILVNLLQGYEQVTKSLDEYFDLKRQMFPFFFYLNNEEMAFLLYQCREIPQKINDFLFNCFENIGKIEFGQTKDQSQQVLAISSRIVSCSYTEIISMGKNIKARGSPEQWLASIEKRLGERLRKLTKEALALLQQALPFLQNNTNTTVVPNATVAQIFLATDFPIQCLLLADRIYRTQIIEAAFKEVEATAASTTASATTSTTRSGSNNNNNNNHNHHFSSELQQEEFVKARYEAYSTSMRQSLVNEDSSGTNTSGSFAQKKNTPVHLTYRENVLYTCILLQEIRFRDAITAHFATNNNMTNIDWSFQLKYVVDDNCSGVGGSSGGGPSGTASASASASGSGSGSGSGEVFVEMNHVRSPYGFHYHSLLHESSFQMISPTNLRFLFGFFGCLRNAQSCLLFGAESSGKSSLTLQMSQILGRICFNGMLSMSSIGSIQHGIKLLRGALHAGGILSIKLIDNGGEKQQQNPRVEMFLRVFANVISSIEHAFLTRMTQVSIDGKLMPLHYYQQTATTVCMSPMLFFSMQKFPMKNTQQTTNWEFITKKWCVFHTCLLDIRYICEAFLIAQQFHFGKVLALRLELLAKYLTSTFFTTTTTKQINFLCLWKQTIFAAGKRLKAFQSSSSKFNVVVSRKIQELHVLKQELYRILVENVVTPQQQLTDTVQMEVYKSIERFLSVPSSELSSTKKEETTIEAAAAEEEEEGKKKDEEEKVEEEKQQELDHFSNWNQILFEDSMAKAIQDLMLVPREELKNQVKQLACQMIQFRGIIIPSDTITGKTTVYQVLAKTMNLIKKHRPIVQQEQHAQQSSSNNLPHRSTAMKSSSSMFSQNRILQQDSSVENPFVSIQVVFPNALTTSQLYGSTQIDRKDGKTIQSVMGNLLRQAQMLLHSGPSQSHVVPAVEFANGLSSLYAFPHLLWIVFDGQLDARWLENLVPILDQVDGSNKSNHVLPLMPFHDGEFMQVAPNLRFLFEIQSLEHASPSFLQSNAIVNMSHISHQHQNQTTPNLQEIQQQHQPLHQSYVYHWFQMHRHRHLLFPPPATATTLSEMHKKLMTFVYDEVLSPWLFEKNILFRLEGLIIEHSRDKSPWSLFLTPFDRVRNFMSLLHSLLNTILLPTNLSTSGAKNDANIGILVFNSNLNNTLLNNGSMSSIPTRKNSSFRSKIPSTSSSNTNEEEKEKQQRMYHDIHVRVEMAILYSLLWGYAGSCSNHFGTSSTGSSGSSVGLKLMVNFFLKKEFESNSTISSNSNGLAETWRQCGKDVNLFDVIMDLPNGRFVQLTSEILMQTSQALLSTKATINSNNIPGGSSSSENAGACMNTTTTTGGALAVRNLFIPTFASLLTHALMKESLRSGRGVLLVDGGGSQECGTNPVYRKTMLLRHFLPQVNSLQRILNPVVEAHSSGSQSSSTSILGRIRLHQVLVAKSLAKRFRNSSNTESEDSAKAHKISPRRRRSLTGASLLGAANPASSTNSVGWQSTETQNSQEEDETEESKIHQGPKLFEYSSESSLLQDAIHKFDNGDQVPFFFQFDAQIENQKHSDQLLYETHEPSELSCILERMLQREHSGVYEPPPGKVAILMIDLHMPIEDKGSQSSRLEPDSISTCDLLRMLLSHAKAYSTSKMGKSITVQDLLLVASLSRISPSRGRRDHKGPLQRLFRHFFPIFVAPMGLHEINHVFLTLLLTHWERASPLERLPSVVKQFLPTVVAATTVLWEKGRRTQNLWSLHELARLYEGLCSTEPSLLAEKDMVMGLWLHESARCLVDRESSKELQMNILQEIFSLKKLIESPVMNHIMSNSGTLPNENNTRGVVLNAGSLSSAVLNHLMNEYLEKKANISKQKPTQHSNQLQVHTPSANTPLTALLNASNKEEDIHNEPLLELWSFLPSGMFFDATNNRSNNQGGNEHGNKSPGQFKRRNSISRAQSVTGSALGKFLYVPILSSSDCSEDTIQHAIVSFYQTTLFTTSSFFNRRGSLTPESARVGSRGKNGPLTTGALRCRASNGFSVSALMSTSDNQQPLKLETALLLGQIARVIGRDGGRLILVSGDSCAEKEQLIRAVCKQQMQELIIFDPPCNSTLSSRSTTVVPKSVSSGVNSKWKDLLLHIYQSAGVENRNVTLFIPRADFLLYTSTFTSSTSSSTWEKQLLYLLIQGNVPNAFTIAEQINMTTKVKDERLIELESLFYTKRSRMIEDLEQQRDEELEARIEELRKENEQQWEMKESSVKQEIEAKYKNILEWKEEQLKVRFQQEKEDLMRKIEVENESLSMTLMSLMRPLGNTSGKWNTILSNLHKKLHVVLLLENNNKTPFESCGSFEKIHLTKMNKMVIQQLLSISLQEQLQFLLRNNDTSHARERTGGEAGASWLEFESFVSTHLLSPQAIEAISSFASSIYQKIPFLASSRSVWTILKQVFSHSIEASYKTWQQKSIKRQRFLDLTKQLEFCLLSLQAHDKHLDIEVASLTKQKDFLLLQKENERVQVDQAKALSLISQNQMDIERQITLQIEKQAEIDLENPKKALQEANIVLMGLEKRHIIEIKSFINPPPLVHLVFDALCILFGMMEPSWENAKKILNDPNIVTSLLQFDFDQVQSIQLDVLCNEYLSNPLFHPQEVNKQSIAAGYIVVWLRAVTLYMDAKRHMQPTIERLTKAQDKLQQATKIFEQTKTQMEICENNFNQLNQQLNETQLLLDKRQQEFYTCQVRNEKGQFLVKEFLEPWKQVYQNELDLFNNEMNFFLVGKNAILKSFLAITGTGTGDSASSSLIATTLENILQEIVSSEIKVISLPAIQLKLATSYQQKHKCSSTGTIQEELIEDPIYYRLLTTGTCFSKVNLERAFWLEHAPSPVAFIKNFSYYMEFYMQKLAKKQWQWHSSYTMVSIRAQDFNVVFEDAMKHGHQLLVLDIDTFESSDCFSSSTQQHPNASLLEEIAKWKTLLIDGVEHLILEKFGYICQEQQQQQESDKNQESTASDSFQPQQQLQLPIHPSFRLFLTSFQDVSYFGCLFEDRFPTLDAAIYLDDVQDMILDELWYTKVRLTAPPTESPTIVAKSSPPSHILAASPNTNKSSVMHKSKSLEGRCFQLYICVKELKEVHEEIAEIKANLCDQIDQSIQVGTFLGDELEQIKQTCHQLKQKEISLKAKCEEVHRNIIQVKQEASRFAKIGAAVYQALQNDKHLPFHLYLQFVSETLSRTNNLSDYSSFLELLLIRMLPLVPRPHWHFFLAHIIKELENSNLKPLSKAYPASMKYQEGEIDELTEVFKHVTLDSLVFEASSSSGDIDRLKQLVLGQPKTELLMYASQAIQEQHHKEKVEGNEKEQTQDNLALSPTEQVIESTTLIPPGSTWWWFRVFCALFPNCYSQWIERFLGVTDRITSPTMGNFSWHSIASKFPQDVGVVFVTPSIGSFDLLQQIFLDGLGTKEDQWNTLKLLLHRHFQTSEDFRDIFTLPRIQQPAHMLALENPNANHTAAASASPSSTSFGTSSISPGSNNEMISSSRNLMGMSPHNSTRNILVATDDTTIIELLTAVDHVLILQRPEEILKEKPEVLMQLRLVILEFFTPILQSPQEELDGITRWEGLLQLLQHSVSRTSSLCLNRNCCSMDSSAGWTNSKWSPPPRRTVAGVANSPVTNDGTTTTPQQSSQLIIKNRLVGSSSLMQPKYTRVVSVVEDMSNIPVHLRGHTLTVQWKSKSERHMAGYFKSVALRLACVPFFKHLEPMLTSSSNMILDAGVTTSTSSINGSTLAWRLLSALLLFHSLLIFRHDTIVSYPACEYPNIDYTWSEFVTAVYLLLDTVETLLHSTEMQKKKRSSNFVTLLKVVQQQILLGVYSRKGEYSGGKTTLPGSGLLLCSCELRFISNLWEECLLVMRIPTKELSSSTTGGSSAITTNNSESLHNILGVFSVSVLGRLTKPDDVLQMFLDASHQLEAFDSNRTAELKLRQFLRLEEHVQLGIIIKRPPLWLEKINYVDVEQTKSAANSILNTLLQALSFFQQEPIQENISSCQTSIIDMHWYEVARSNTICINQLKKYLESLKAQNGTKEDEEQENEQDTKQAIMLNHVPASFQRYVPWTLMNLQDFMLSLRSSYQFFSHSFTQKKIWYAPAVSSITGLIEMARLHYYETFSLASNNSPVESMTISSTTDSSVDDIEIEFYLVRAFDPVVMKEQEPDKTNDNFTLILSGLKLVGARWNEKFKVLDNIDTSSSSSTSSITLREKWEKNVWLIAKFQDKKICTTSNTTGPPFGAQGTDKKRRTFRNKALCPLVRRRGGSLEQSMKSDVETLYEFELPASSSFSPFTVPILQYTHT